MALVAILLHVVVFATLHVLNPDLGLIESLYTDYLGTESATLTRVGFLLFASTWAALALALRSVLPAGLASNIVTVLLLLASASLGYSSTLDAAAADPRLAAGPSVLRGAIGLFRLGLFVSLVVASISLRRVQGWRRVAQALTVVSAVNLAILVLSLTVLLDCGWAGLGQRLVFALTYTWVVAVAWRMLRRPATREEVRSP